MVDEGAPCCRRLNGGVGDGIDEGAPCRRLNGGLVPSTVEGREIMPWDLHESNPRPTWCFWQFEKLRGSNNLSN